MTQVTRLTILRVGGVAGLLALLDRAPHGPGATPTAPGRRGEPEARARGADAHRRRRRLHARRGIGHAATGRTRRPDRALDERLRQSGDLTAARADPAFFDPVLETAVRRFQTRHGLDADGLVGRRTLAQLNETPHGLAERVRVNLDRAATALPIPLGRFIVVNVPGFTLTAYRDGERLLHMPVIVGRPDRPTPLFQARVTNLVVNPDWTVPPEILRKDVARRMLDRDLEYLMEHGFRLVTADSSQLLGFDAANWFDIAAGRRALRLVQPPGPSNPLGRIKFLMPNPDSIYLHGTNEPKRFESPERALSSGCIRVADPVGLAAFVTASADPIWRDWIEDPAW